MVFWAPVLPPPPFFFTFKYFVPALVLFLSGFPKCVIVPVGVVTWTLRCFPHFWSPVPLLSPWPSPPVGLGPLGASYCLSVVARIAEEGTHSQTSGFEVLAFFLITWRAS